MDHERGLRTQVARGGYVSVVAWVAADEEGQDVVVDGVAVVVAGFSCRIHGMLRMTVDCQRLVSYVYINYGKHVRLGIRRQGIGPEVLMIEGLRSRITLLWVACQQFLQQINSVGTDTDNI
jgi:hypothetical protein